MKLKKFSREPEVITHYISTQFDARGGLPLAARLAFLACVGGQAFLARTECNLARLHGAIQSITSKFMGTVHFYMADER